jgi:Protein of unknown function (DUF3105)
VASRKEQKEKLRQERLKREEEAKAAEARKRMIGYGVAGVLGVGLLVAIVLIATAGGGGGGKKASGGSKAYPSGFDVPKQKITDLKQAAAAAQCQLKSFKSTGRNHVQGNVKYNSNPPTNGDHFPVPAEDGAYAKAPPITHLVHVLEHGRIIMWFKPGAPAKVRGTLKAVFDDDPYQMVLTPNTTHMPYEVAASAWGREPTPNGRGYLLACPKYTDGVPDAIRAFRDEHRGNGPEAIP